MLTCMGLRSNCNLRRKRMHPSVLQIPNWKVALEVALEVAAEPAGNQQSRVTQLVVGEGGQKRIASSFGPHLSLCSSNT